MGFTGEYEFSAPEAENSTESVPEAVSSAVHIPKDSITPAVEIDYSSNSFYLPETGGIGTAPFYIIGGIIASVAAVLLIMRFRCKK